jgi:hypothetical protein
MKGGFAKSDSWMGSSVGSGSSPSNKSTSTSQDKRIKNQGQCIGLHRLAVMDSSCDSGDIQQWIEINKRNNKAIQQQSERSQ